MEKKKERGNNIFEGTPFPIVLQPLSKYPSPSLTFLSLLSLYSSYDFYIYLIEKIEGDLDLLFHQLNSPFEGKFLDPDLGVIC